MAYACVRTDNMSGTTLGKDTVSVKYYVSTTPTAIENGNVVLVGDLMTGEREVRKATAPAANSPLGSIALIASEEVVKDKDVAFLNEFRNEAGEIARGYRLASHDVFAVTADALAGTAEVGSVIELQAGTKLKAVAELTSGSTKVGTCIALEGEWIVIEVA